MKRSFLLFCLLILSCSSPKNQEQIDVFEAKLGKENVEILDLLVDNFENNLRQVYPKLHLKEAYREYLFDIIYDNFNSQKLVLITKDTKSIFHNSALWDEVYQNTTNKGLEINNLGKYMMSLYEIKDSDSLIKKYYTIREAAGIIQNKIFANGILSMNPDFDNYFHKRIVVIEFSY